MQGSLLFDATLSGLEELPQDILTNIYRYLFPGSYACNFKKMSANLSATGMISKHMFQSCAKYVRHQPMHLPYKLKLESFKTMAFFLGNAAKVKDISLKYEDVSRSTFMTFLMLKALDLSELENLDITCSRSYDDDVQDYIPISAKDKWELVEDGLVSIPFVKELCQKSMIDVHREYSQCIAASAPSLHSLCMNIGSCSFDVYNSLFMCVIDRLVKLDLDYISEAVDDDLADDRKEAFKKIEQLVCIAPRLEDLTIHYGWSNTIYDKFKIHSESLQSLSLLNYCDTGPAIKVLDINCSTLTSLDLRIVPGIFDPNQFSQSNSCGVIKDMHIVFDNLQGTSSAELSMARKQVLEMLNMMSS